MCGASEGAAAMRRATLMPPITTGMVALVGQVAGMDRRVLARIGRADGDAAAAVGAQLADRRGEGGEAVRPFAGLVGAQRLHVELDVGPDHARSRAREDRHLACRQCQRPGARQHVLDADPQLVERVVDLVVERPLAGLEHQPHLEVVLQVLADAGQVVQHRHARAPQQAGGADSRTLQDLRRADGAGGKDHFRARRGLAGLPALDEFDAGRALSLEQHAGGLRPRFDLQVRPAASGLEEALGRAPAQALVAVCWK
jgi:hypothetical protein